MENSIDYSIVNSPDFSEEQAIALARQICAVPEMKSSVVGLVQCEVKMKGSVKEGFLSAMDTLRTTGQSQI